MLNISNINIKEKKITMDVLSTCLLSFNQEKTANHPAKIDPSHQLVVFSNAVSGQELTLTRSETYSLLENTEEENITRFGISTIDAAEGYSQTDYSILSPDNSVL